MPGSEHDAQHAIRQRAYFIWEREGRPEGRAQDHWLAAAVEEFGEPRDHGDDCLEDEEKVLAGRPDANFPALLTRDVPGG